MDGEGNKDARAKSAGVAAVEAGLTSGLTALAASSVGVVLANRFWPAFRNGLNVSGKTALVVTPFFFYFFLDAEHKMNEVRRTNYRSRSSSP